MDLYIEKVNPDNPNQYEVNGQWVDFEIRKETIDVVGEIRWRSMFVPRGMDRSSPRYMDR